MQQMKRIGMLTSGGDCQALNAAMRSVVKGLSHNVDELEIYGFYNGYKGLIYGDYRLLTSKDFSGILTKGGTILGSSRQPFKLMRVPDENGLDKVEAMKQTYHKLKLDCLVILGGNGTQKTANLLREEGLNVIHLPKTIDNDLCETDHTPGFGSAAKYIASSLLEIAHDTFIYAVKSVTIVEIMGRHAGWLTAASVLARKFENDNPVLIYLPESAFNTDTFIEDVKKALEHTSNLVVCVSEGINDGNGTFICELASDVGVDTFGHKMLTGSGKYLENLVKEKLGVKVRSIELNVNQRCSSSMISATDQEEAIQAGISGVHFALDGITGKMIAFHRTEGADYSINYVPEDVNLICNQEKTVPPEWITGNGSDIGQAFIDYALPLIQGIVNVPEENGLPKFAYRK
mgnify:CR=1 FL=1